MELPEHIRDIHDRVAAGSDFVERVTGELGKVIVGQHALIERILIALFTGGHCLIQGVPGLAKTLTVNTLARTLAARFQRVQFTPDLLPADIIGTTIYDMQTGRFSHRKGPLFANLVLADEINRAPAKVQSALLEAMQERSVTIGDTTHPLPEPFLVMATQNPIEHEGTYPLPEAQLDRFMLMVEVGYPDRAEERRILDLMTATEQAEARAVASLDDVRAARELIARIHIDDKVREYIIDLVQATRAPGEYGLPELAPLIEYGASPRATIFLAVGARAHAFLRHRGYVTPDDVKAVGLDVLRHRIILGYEAEADEVRASELVARIFERIEVP
jgi:MoxR-like ATPase